MLRGPRLCAIYFPTGLEERDLAHDPNIDKLMSWIYGDAPSARPMGLGHGTWPTGT